MQRSCWFAMSDRISQCFEKTKREGRASFVAYVCAGDPDFDTSLEVCRALIAGGVDILELGVPFSDPLADGLTNQLAAQRALENGMTHAHLLELIKALRAEAPELPIVLYTYYNLVFASGLEANLKQIAEAGADGLLTLDCPPEEAEDLVAHSKAEGLANIFIIAPTTPPERMKLITESASGFIYYVSRTGVTGVRDSLPEDLSDAVAGIKRHTELPIAVGFGISTPEQVQAVGAVADGVVVGSAIVNCIPANLGDSAATVESIREKIAYLAGRNTTLPL